MKTGIKKAPVASLRPPKRRRLSEDISGQIREAIFNGQYKPGDKLPPENELGGIFQVGRPVVREALRSLENSGLIFVKSGSGGGAFIRKISSRILSETIEGIVRLDQVSMEELTEARLAVEISVLPMVVQRIQPEDMAALEQNLREAEESLRQGREEPKNLQFHILLAKACHNELLIKITEALLRVLARILRGYEYSYDRKKRVLEEHRHIFKLLKAKKYKAMEKALMKHIEETVHHFEKAVLKKGRTATGLSLGRH